MGIETRLVGKNQGSRGTQVAIVYVQVLLVEGSEVVENAEAVSGPSHFQQAVTVVIPGLRTVVGSVAGDCVDVSELVSRWPRSAQPNRRLPSVRRDFKKPLLLKRLRVISKKPAVVVVNIATIPAKSDVDGTIFQKECGTLQLILDQESVRSI